MSNYYEKAEIFAWMPMIGFDKNEPDKGVSKFLSRTKYTPHGTSAFLFSPDIVHHHNGLDTEVVLPPDNCSYYANPYNEERRRQEWTNKDLKALIDNLNAVGIEPYIGIMGADCANLYHDEWLHKHPELRSCFRDGTWGLNVLKRFKDGTYYEDFFADKICEVVTEYGFRGLHVADNFCPSGGTIYRGDFSDDMLDQFSMHTGIEIPENLLALDENNLDDRNVRGDWVWYNRREEWINFHAWRWEGFWKKICDRLHAINVKVFVLGMYCTDPFETLYYLGVDLKKIVNAGVDYLMPNMAANGSSVRHNRTWRYYEQANMMPLTDVFVDGGRKLNMLGVKDATEEWDMLHHEPVLLERDISFLPSFIRKTPDGMKRCIDGFNVCLADGIYEDEWKWLFDRFDIAMGALPKKSIAPTYVWSDHAFYSLLPEYIKTRRWSVHKFMYELNWLGAVSNSVIRSEHIDNDSGDLFVPNFDLMSEEEKRAIAAYKGGTVICTAEAGFNPQDYGIVPDIYFEDKNTPFVHCAFAYNTQEIDTKAILDMLDEEGDMPIIDVDTAAESHYTLHTFLPHQKVTRGFLKALATLIKENYKKIFSSESTVVPALMEDGAIRMMVINDDRLHYESANITINHRKIREVKNVSRFPLLPVKYTSDGTYSPLSPDTPNGLSTFRVLVPSGGISIVDVYLED